MDLAYVAVITREGSGRPYEVMFPDCPGCVTVGDTLTEALENAKEALDGWLETMIETGQAVPSPAEAEDAGQHMQAGAFVTLIVAEPPAPKVVPVTITIREDQLRAIDAKAKEVGMSRSAFLAQSATGAASMSVGSIPKVTAVRGITASDHKVGIAAFDHVKNAAKSTRTMMERVSKGGAETRRDAKTGAVVSAKPNRSRSSKKI